MLINDYLSNNNITKYSFAKMYGLPYGTLNDICNGKTDISKCKGETLYKIARAIGCTVDMLLCERMKTAVFDADKIKAIVTPIAIKHNLRSVYLFGSYSTNNATEDSDIDLLIDREDSDIHGLFGMNSLLEELKSALGKDVDLITVQSLKQKSTISDNSEFIENIMRERIKIYG